MNNQESDEHMESIASGLEPVSLDATDALERAGKDAQAEATQTDSAHASLYERAAEQLRKLLRR